MNVKFNDANIASNSKVFRLCISKMILLILFYCADLECHRLYYVKLSALLNKLCGKVIYMLISSLSGIELDYEIVFDIKALLLKYQERISNEICRIHIYPQK